MPAIISNVIDFFTGASPEQTAAHNAAFVDVGEIVGGTALAPILLGTGIVGAEITTNFVLTNPIVSTEIAGGVTSTLLGGPDFASPTSSFPGFAAGEVTARGIEEVNSLPSVPASGGFVLYPSRPNTNQIQQVYQK